MNEILVTGGSGFIGRFLVRELVKEGKKVIVLDKRIDTELQRELPKVRFYEGDITKGIPWEKLLDEVDTVYHLAGLLGTSELFPRIIEAETVNVLGTLTLLENMRKYDVNKIVFTSKPNIWKHNVYTITKENCERYLRMYHEIYDIKTVILCPYNVYGPEEKIEEYRKAVPYFIISALQNKPLEVYGNGEQTMDLIHVRDAVRAFLLAGENEKAVGKTIEIGSATETSVNHLAEMIIKLSNSKSKIVHIPMRKGEVENTRLCASISDMRVLLDFIPKIELEEGLEDTIKHYRETLKKYI